MFIDTSVFVAILAAEPDADQLSDQIAQAKVRLTSPLVMLEATMRLSTLLDLQPTLALASIEKMVTQSNIRIVEIGADEGKSAVMAFETYGKGRGHPAQLNLADCMSYACAKARSVPLLYKGNDFAQTDLA